MRRRKGFKTQEEKENSISLDPVEKETIINFNQGEKKASIFTYERDWQRYFERMLEIKPIFVDGWGGREYLVDKNKIKIAGMVGKEKRKVEKDGNKVRAKKGEKDNRKLAKKHEKQVHKNKRVPK